MLVWTVNGEAVKDKDGKVIPVSSTPKAPEFKYEKGVWYYRVGEGEWTACSEGEASAIEVIELDDVVLITIGDTVITLPKESVSAPIESIATVFKVKANRLFVPVGKTIDLKEWFTVAPEGALKTMVDYTFFKTVNDQEIDLEGDELAAVPLAIDSKGVLTASGSGPYSIRISSKLDKTIKTNIFIRAGECPDDVVPAVSIDPKERIDIFKGSFEEYNKMTNFSGTASWNPFNNSLAGVFNGNWNFRVGMPVTPNANITMANGHLHLLFYVPDVSYLKPNDDPLFELTSGGANDVDEINWKVSQFATGLKNGWNEVDLKLSDAAAGPGKFDPSKANFFRIVINAQTPDGSYHPFQFRDVFVYAAEPDPTVITSQADIDALHGEGLTVPGSLIDVPISSFAGAFMKGLAQGGVLNCLKHFPGHGNTTTDSHLAMPVVAETLSSLRTTSLVPFQQLLPMADSVMIGHLLVPALDDKTPASLSKTIVHDLLQRDMGFKRCVCTDALLMKALGDEKQAALQALDAGAHLLLVPENPLELINFLKTQVFPDDMLCHIESILNQLCAQAEELTVAAKKSKISPTEFTLHTAKQALVEKGFIAPLSPGDTVHFLEVGNDENLSSVPFFDTLRAYGIVTEPFEQEAEFLIILFWRRYKPFSGKIGLTDEEKKQVTQAIAHSQQTALLCFANPWMVRDIKAQGTLFAFSPAPAFQQAAAECLMGELIAQGKLPIKL